MAGAVKVNLHAFTGGQRLDGEGIATRAHYGTVRGVEGEWGSAAGSIDVLEGLNLEQAEAVSTLTGPVMIVAGPGSGKTRVLTRRIAALVQSGVWPRRILAVTFTNKAAGEMRERLTTMMGHDTVSRMWVATFHSVCLRILRIHHEAAGLPASFTVLDSDDAKRVLATVMSESGALEGLDPAEAKDAVKEAAAIISNAKNDGRTPDDVARGFTAWAAAPYAAYNERLTRMGAVDFDDLLERTYKVLAYDEAVRGEVAARFDHILVDEYQDTNPIQESILRLLGRHRNVCVVGDPDQSIYAFRGATPGVLEDFARSWPGAKVIRLGRNYRSSANIVAAAAAVIAPNEATWRAELVTEAEAGERVCVYNAPDSYREAEWVADRIANRGAPWSEQAVLVRVAALTSGIERELRVRGVPYKMVAGTGFYDRAEVKDVLAWLRVALNPKDEVAFARAVGAPKRGVGGKTTAEVQALMGTGMDVYEAIENMGAKRGLMQFAQAAHKVAEAAQEGVSEAILAVREHTGLGEALEASAVKDGIDRAANLDALLEDAVAYVSSKDSMDAEGTWVGSLPGVEQCAAFIAAVALSSAAVEEEGDAVSLMTIHAAKGREFDHVYVPGVEESILPHARSLRGSAREEAEERRLMYVAVSRARKTLDLSWAGERTQYGKHSYQAPSRYLNDLPDDAVANWQAEGKSRSATWVGARAPVQKPKRELNVAAGERVTHFKFGAGVVEEVNGNLIAIRFDDGVRRNFDATIAPLEKVP